MTEQMRPPVDEGESDPGSRRDRARVDRDEREESTVDPTDALRRTTERVRRAGEEIRQVRDSLQSTAERVQALRDTARALGDDIERTRDAVEQPARESTEQPKRAD